MYQTKGELSTFEAGFLVQLPAANQQITERTPPFLNLLLFGSIFPLG
jgi:hypothetical protein